MENWSTVHVQDCLDRLRRGDVTATKELFERCNRRIEVLARRMIRDFPGLRGREETADIRQEVCLRLVQVFENHPPVSIGHLLGLVADHIRWELLDRVRHYRKEIQLRMDVQSSWDSNESPEEKHPAIRDRDSDYERWELFHLRAAELAPPIRAVFQIHFYEGRTLEETSEALKISLSTVNRHWLAARLFLSEKLTVPLTK